MKRVSHPPRLDWQTNVEKLGLIFHSPDGQAYWDESAHYEFDSAEIDALEKATNDLSKMCLDAVDHVIQKERFTELNIPAWVVPAIKSSWNGDVPSLYGRFDLAYDGAQIKLLEYNADTPTSLLEAAVIQWHWLQDFEATADQFNDIWEALTAKWKSLAEETGALKSTKVSFACEDHIEDLMTVAVLMDTAQEAGLTTEQLWLNDLGWEGRTRRFVNLQDQPIDVLFKLHPWETLINEQFGAQAIDTYSSMQWIEPAWKMVVSNKAILALLWELNPNHPNLLPAFVNDKQNLVDFVKKPFLSREGANVTVVRNGITVASTEGDYGKGPFVYQRLASLPEFDGMHPVIGSWLIDHEAHGIGIRESKGLVTDDLAHFVPHLFR